MEFLLVIRNGHGEIVLGHCRDEAEVIRKSRLGPASSSTVLGVVRMESVPTEATGVVQTERIDELERRLVSVAQHAEAIDEMLCGHMGRSGHNA